MSAFYSVAFPDRIEMLTDGAIYSPDGILLATAEKVHRSAHLPMAMTSRGSFQAGRIFMSAIDQLAGTVGSFDVMASCLSQVLDGARGEIPEEGDCEVLIAGFSECAGPVHLYFTTAAYVPGVEAFTVISMPPEILAGTNPGLRDRLRAVGLTPDHFRNGLAEHGADLMQVMREQPGPNPVRPDLPEVYGIGGHVDLTVITADTVTTTRLRTWLDVIGEVIDPFRSVVEQTPIAA